MSRDATVERTFADGDYTFRLGFKELVLLQEKRDCGPLEILNRLNSGLWRVEDIAETIRIALIGGGLKPVDALKLVRTYVEARPPMENLALAVIIMGAGLAGSPDEPLGESLTPSSEETMAASSGSTISQTANSDGPNSTESPQPSAADPIRSTDGLGFNSGPPSPATSAPIESTTAS